MNILKVVALISELWCITTGAADVPQWLHFLDRVKMTLNSLLHFLQAISAREELLGEGGGPLSRGRPRPSAIFKESRTKGGEGSRASTHGIQVMERKKETKT